MFARRVEGRPQVDPERSERANLFARRNKFRRLQFVALLALTVQGSAVADPLRTGPVVTIRSAGGNVTVEGTGGAEVRVSTGNAALSHFSVGETGEARVRLPRIMRWVRTAAGMRLVFLPPRHFALPESLLNDDGTRIVNASGDLTIRVPQRLGGLFIHAAAGEIVVKKVSTPFVIDGEDGSVRLRGVAGHGLVRTVTGDIDVGGVAGFLRLESGTGTISAEPGMAERAHISTEWGDINWTFGHLGRGEYRFRTRGGVIRLLLRPDAGALVDAQSDAGRIINRFSPGAAELRFASAHQLSLEVGGGGPEISAYTRRGTIVIGPAPR